MLESARTPAAQMRRFVDDAEAGVFRIAVRADDAAATGSARCSWPTRSTSATRASCPTCPGRDADRLGQIASSPPRFGRPMMAITSLLSASMAGGDDGHSTRRSEYAVQAARPGGAAQVYAAGFDRRLRRRPAAPEGASDDAAASRWAPSCWRGLPASGWPAPSRARFNTLSDSLSHMTGSRDFDHPVHAWRRQPRGGSR